MWRKISAFSRESMPDLPVYILASLPGNSTFKLICRLKHFLELPLERLDHYQMGNTQRDMDDFFIKLITVSFHILFAGGSRI